MAESGTVSVKIDRAVWRPVTAVLVGGMAVLFDTTIVAVALHSLATDLHVSVATIQWVSTAYLLTLGATIPIAGWAQRVLGSRRLWMIALAVFLVGSILSSLAWSAGSLIGFRVVQGVGGGLMLPLMSTLVMQAAGGKNLGKVMSVISLPTVLGPILGPVIGGLILQHLHWSWLFWVNVPFCIAGLILAVLLLPADGPTRAQHLDVIGLLLMAAGLVGILLGITDTNGAGGFGRADVLVPLIVGVVCLAAFVGWTLRRRGRALIDVRLLAHWPLASSSLLLFLSGLTLYGAMVLIPLYFEELRGATVLQAGLLLIPQGLGTLASRSVVGRLSDRMSARLLTTVGFAVVLAGTVPFAFASPQANEWVLLGALFVRGAGLGGATIPLMALAFRGLNKQDVPDASIVTRIAQQIGGSFGTAVLTLILTGTATAASTAAIGAAFQETFWWATGFTIAGVLLALTLPGKPVPDATAPSMTLTAAEHTPDSAPAAKPEHLAPKVSR